MSRSFKDMSVEDYLKRLGSGDPTPGGGAAAALSSAQGAALIMMVTNHTIGKPRYAEFEELNKEVLAEAEVLMKSLEDGMDNDAEAFKRVSAAYSMPKSFSDIQIDRVSVEIARLKGLGHDIDDIGDDGMTVEIMDQIESALKAERADAISAASVLAAEAPLMVMGDSLSGLRLAASLKGHSNKNLESDIRVAALCLYAGIRSAFYNVDVNLPAIERADQALASEMRQSASRILTEAKEAFAKIFEAA